MKNKKVKLFVTVTAASMVFYLIFLIFSSFLKYDSSFSTASSESNLRHVSFLSDEVKETSGLAYFNNQLFTHNDAGNRNIIYALDKENGRIKDQFTVSDAQNIDWEDLAQNDTHIFVGDMGNNDGNRNDQKIYRIRKSALENKGSGNVKIDGTIGFKLSDQTQFNSKKKHNFDTEALIYYRENLYLFSKNRGGTLCNIYRIPSKSGNYNAELVDSFNVPGLITGAAISPSNSRILLTAYNKKDNCFLYSLDNFNEDKFSSGKHTLINLGPYTNIGQLEGVVFEDEKNIFLSTEKTKDRKASLYKLEL